ncbi:DNA-cytosine methyltransferase [Mucinivorans hirudinis]|uniref:Cytosine-specific methyltransferase n=1 Tax=Mucinivorans hirudinis TaxID=1433126 RepID=A0A060RDL9_9BACT|nr:DNA-cytosine methyltransferase [Mucinivorans hirudinis]
MKPLKFIDLFAGAGGLSEGFIRQGYTPIAHVEMNTHACDTLKTRMVYHQLATAKDKLGIYTQYLKGQISRDEFWSHGTADVLDSVINIEISDKTIDSIFDRIDKLKQEDSVDIVIGGPPCQAYSVAGRARDPQSMETDPRNFLYKYYLQFLQRYKPKMFVFENVPGILSAKNGEHFENIKKGIEEAGYNLDYRILDASKFGVIQNRKRVILIGWQKELKLSYPEFEQVENNNEILRDLFYDLPWLAPGTGEQTTLYTKPCNTYLNESKIRSNDEFVTQHIVRPHNTRDIEIYRRAITMWLNERKRLNYATLPDELKTHSNQKSFLNRFQVVDNIGCSHTVVAHIAMDGHYYIYPDLKQIRSISIREAARIQSFPDNYFFEGGRTNAFKQIGNAVPVLMADKIANKLIEQLKRL